MNIRYVNSAFFVAIAVALALRGERRRLALGGWSGRGRKDRPLASGAARDLVLRAVVLPRVGWRHEGCGARVRHRRRVDQQPAERLRSGEPAEDALQRAPRPLHVDAAHGARVRRLRPRPATGARDPNARRVPDDNARRGARAPLDAHDLGEVGRRALVLAALPDRAVPDLPDRRRRAGTAACGRRLPGAGPVRRLGRRRRVRPQRRLRPGQRARRDRTDRRGRSNEHGPTCRGGLA